ncbi:MAG: sulfite dehydrogenase [Bryobacteraceae bacterium]
MKPSTPRRRFLALGAALAACKTKPPAPVAETEPSRLGKPVSEYGDRSAFETAKRRPLAIRNPEATASLTPLADSRGILTPSSLHFERHHGGVPKIDPASHRLILHGLVERPLSLSVAEIRRLPAVSRILFVECSGNGSRDWFAKRATNVQLSAGLVSCSEWTGVPLKILLEEAGLKREAKWIVAEGADAPRMQRSIPVAKALDDILVAWGQNGEALRPEQGYPLRLVIPGWEGNASVKWLRQLRAVDQPAMTRDETSKYTDLMADGTSRQFTFVMDAKSVITSPSGGQKLDGAGAHEITGLAWSGRGAIARVEVTTDGGATWKPARLDSPRLPMAFTRFHFPWSWDGREVSIASRAVDETGYEQPPVEALIAVRGANSNYHNNGIKWWKVGASGEVTHVDA